MVKLRLLINIITTSNVENTVIGILSKEKNSGYLLIGTNTRPNIKKKLFLTKNSNE